MVQPHSYPVCQGSLISLALVGAFAQSARLFLWSEEAIFTHIVASGRASLQSCQTLRHLLISL